MHAHVPRWWVGLATITLLAPLAGVSGIAAAAPLLEFHGLHQGSTSSSNWAGFAATGSKGSVTFVKGSWIVPKIQGTCPAGYRYSSFWVGIDGFTSGSVEQTGTDSDCQGGSPTYYAWYEFYPKPSHVITSLTVSAGDTISASVTYASGKFTTKITDTATGKSYSATAKVAAARTSAEWIAEAPSSSTGVLPLADFGTVPFGIDYTSVKGTDNATISGTNGAVGSFGHVSSITMVSSGGKTKAVPSGLSTDLTSFTVAWKSAGP
ncbi:MAG TPA: G1 family glutamic endopeptidase [Thermoplasmata archaeon]|nr:G1 family glutamic endopeptidase [Thermoplasmata archaeon]